jgi:enoyl-CoA hydratase
MTDDLLIETRDDVLVVTLNRPQARNAINGAIFTGIGTALARLDQDPALRVAILAGAGGNFCSGMDLKAFVKGEIPSGGDDFQGLVPRTRKPLIAAVDGHALAGGFELLLFCDLVVASRGARFGIPEVKRGLASGGGGLTMLADLIPYRVAVELALTGEAIDAERAQAIGLVNRIVEGPALDGALMLARAIADNGPMAVRQSKAILAQSRDWPRDERFARQRAELGALFASHDAREGALAFAEKRKPVWKDC